MHELLYGLHLLLVSLGQLIILGTAHLLLWADLSGLIRVLRGIFNSEKLWHSEVLRACELVRSEVVG